MDIPTHNTEERGPAQTRANQIAQVHLKQTLTTSVMKKAWIPKQNNQELFQNNT